MNLPELPRPPERKRWPFPADTDGLAKLIARAAGEGQGAFRDVAMALQLDEDRLFGEAFLKLIEIYGQEALGYPASPDVLPLWRRVLTEGVSAAPASAE